ncbi:MAG: SH3 domain-containing protein [Christensenellales bacterium]
MMRKANSLLKTLLVMALMAGTLAFAGAALADGTVVEFTTYTDGTTTVSSYALSERGEGYAINTYMAISPWSFTMDPSGINMSSSAVIEAWEAGMREWNRYLEKPMFTLNNSTSSVTLPRDSDGEIAKRKDGLNTISFAKLGGTKLAMARAYMASGTLSDEYPVSRYADEVDIIFNSDIDWVNVAINEEGYDLQSIATHEIGHTLGLGDVYDAAYNYVTMYAYGTRNSVDQRTLAEPDIKGLSNLYKVYGYDDPVKPTATPEPTAEPTPDPSASAEPSLEPTQEPTGGPTTTPTVTPTVEPTAEPTATPTVAPVLTATVNTTSGNLNMRAAASATSAKLTSIPRGATVTVLEKGTTWSRISYGGYTGYVMTQYLKFDGGSTAQPTGTPTPGGSTATVIASRLNMRASASTTGALLTKIPNGATVTVLGTTGAWSHIRYGSYTGYVMSQYLRINGSSTAQPTAAPTQEPTAEPTIGTATVTSGSRLNMRSAKSTSASVVTRIPSGATVGVISYASDWSKVTYNGYTGYVSSPYISMNGSQTETPATTKPDDGKTYKTVTISGSATKLNMRSGAGTGYALVGQVPKGTRVELISDQGEWSQISYNGLNGYVMSTYLK